MAEEKGTTSPVDMLDIIFDHRNKSYGAYQLRRSYPAYLGRALLYSALLLAFALLVPRIFKSVSGALASREKPVDVVAELGPPPDIDPNNPPPPPPPPPPTPPPPTRSTVAFVPPVVKKDIEVVEEKEIQDVKELEKSEKDIGKETKEGNDDAAPEIFDNPDTKLFDDAPAKQVVEEKTYELFDIQKPPSFPGGDAELMKYLAENIKYPPLARENNITGRCAITFVVNKDGSISDVQIMKDIGGGCGKEAQRVVSQMPKWTPGEANGHPVKVRYTLPVLFQLQ